ncbi:SusC/RagA family TonB-linked outer membrane protein [Chitinophaga arvensicola]|uniref:TonB-linked outer membrane protein, SusC/RagA family n=1 Tax=Chitinophaga arvensicola TaxID=29529 RepID=A0A1I0R3W6_9BACT|nr:SusC/RagA family TonB-linked outer membrane protein [Chitinophaga arvensicola]SEW35169.1 TonB-linked outer membrane protein, SusC/RagA family [Chitinophaga arvensicola]
MRLFTQCRALFLLWLPLILIAGNAIAQERIIKGKVSGTDGVAIPGVSVREKGKSGGAFTNEGGEFSIKTSGSFATLVFSYVGYLPQEVNTGSESSFSITLKEDNKRLDEVVVTAMGIRKEAKRLGYSVQEVKGADLVKARDPNPINSLAGKVAGLTVGANPEMLGRPEIVLRGSKDLLFVVDGAPINSDTWNINPDDIESYSVLKGANAAALYGFRGINGAIVITTKRGTKDSKGWQVDVNSSTMLEKGFLALPKIQEEYGRGTTFKYSYGDQLYDNGQRLPEWGPRFEGQPIKQYDSPYDPVSHVRTATPWTARGKDNFQKFMEDGVINNNNISLSTATDRSDIRISLSNMNQKGMNPNTKLHTYTLAINAGYKITDKLKIEASANINKQYSPNIPDVNYGPNSYIYMFQVYGSADYDINDLKDIYKGPQGVPNLIPYAQEYGRENSAWFIAKKWLRSHDKTDINGYIKASYKFNDALNLNLRTQITTWNQLRTEQVPAGTNLNTYTPWYYFGWYGDYREDRRNLFENNTDLILNYDKKVGKFNISALAGGSMRSFNYNSLWGTTKALAIPNVYVLTNSKEQYSSYTWDSKMQVYSGFYSFDVTYGPYLTLSHTGRVDHVSTLADGYNTFYYPSVSLSSVINDYVSLPKFISLLKVRGSYANVKGALTSPTAASAFTQITGKSTNSGLLGYGTDLYTSYDGPTYNNQMAYSLANYYNNQPSADFSSTISNPTLKPFTVSSYEAGLDLRLFNNRLGADFTYFTSLNGPQIFALGVAPSTSYSAHNVNAITSKKKGFEIALNAAPLRNPKGLNWDLSVNYATYKETLNDIYGDEQAVTLNNHNYKKGERLDAIYGPGFVHDGSGNIVYSGGLPLRAPSDIGNNKLLGYANPDFSFGFTNRFSYKNFSLSFQVDGRIGGKIFNEVYKDGMNGGTALASASGDFGKARLADWQSTNNGTVAPTGHYIAPGVKIVSGTPVYQNGEIVNMKDIQFAPNDVATTVQTFVSSGIGNVNEYWMVDRSFAKLREVTLGYSLPSKFLQRNRFIKAASFSLVGRNLLYFSKSKDIDLDQFASGYNDTDRSLGNGGVLQSMTARRMGFNVNLSF